MSDRQEIAFDRNLALDRIARLDAVLEPPALIRIEPA